MNRAISVAIPLALGVVLCTALASSVNAQQLEADAAPSETGGGDGSGDAAEAIDGTPGGGTGCDSDVTPAPADVSGDPLSLASPDPAVIVRTYLDGGGTRDGESRRASAADEASPGDIASTATIDLLEAVGTVVVRRAQASAMEWARDRIALWLGCDDNAEFARTCALLKSTSLVALAGEADTLLRALVGDALAKAMEPALAQPQLAPLLNAIAAVVTEVELDNPARVLQQVVAELHVATVRAHRRGEDLSTIMCADQASSARALASVALMWCAVDTASTQRELQDCAIVERVDALSLWCELNNDAPVDRVVRQRAGRYASGVQAALVGQGADDSQEHPLSILRNTVRLVLDMACDEANWSEGCVELSEISELNNGSSAYVLSLVRAVIEPILDEDYVSATTALIRVLTIQNDANNENRRRAVSMLGRIVSIAGSYSASAPPDLDADEAEAWMSEQRARVVDAIAREFASRSGRGGRTVASFGGSLRLVLGADIALRGAGDSDAHGAVHQPLSLPIGFAVQMLPRGRDRGFHFDVSPVDLGQWISFEDGGGVDEFDLGDVLAPSITVGFMWGRTSPLVAGLTGGWLPNYDGDDDPDETGAGFIGVSLGIFIPIVDVN